MKSSILAIIIAVVIVVGGIGYVVYSNPSLLSGSKSSSPQTLSGMNIVSTNTVNSSMGGGWYEGFNVTGGLSNISNLESMFSGQNASIGASGMHLLNKSGAQIRFFQFAGFGNSNNSSLLFGYMQFSSKDHTNFINETVSGNLTRVTSSTGTYNTSGITSNGAFYVFISNKTTENYYNSAIYAKYSNYILAGVYIGSKNISASNLTSLVSNEVTILNTQTINYRSAERLVQPDKLNTVFNATNWSSDFNFSLNYIKSTGMLENIMNSSASSYLGQYSPIANASRSNLTGLGISAFSNGSTGGMLLGYLQARNVTLAGSAFANLSTNMSGYNGYVNSTTPNGTKYFNISYPGSIDLPGAEIFVGQYQSYLIFEVYSGPTISNANLQMILDEEASYL
ncbi:MAG: hypothetical protein B2I17_07145 [Thermoplasmatales archaeon B_DKE]|nr:MAG: hypothetical protein B2I17_07145 [Thermoplasmatales archaeon B_DKE]